MRRTAAVLFIAAIIGCGQDAGAPVADSGREPGAGVPTRMDLPAAAFSMGVTDVKVVLKSVDEVTTPVQVYDEGTDTNWTPTCTVAADCAPFAANSHCAAGNCAVTRLETAIFYAENVQNPSLNAFTFPVPCDGRHYSAQIFGGTRSGMAIQIVDMQEAAKIVVGPGCVVTNAPAWNPLARPTLGIPTIYAGLPAPYDTYVVAVNGIASPMGATYTMTANGVAAGKYAGPRAVFTSPSTTAVLNFVATLRLENAINPAAEQAWQLAVAGSATPVGSTPISGP
jgi:hypothetical protein